MTKQSTPIAQPSQQVPGNLRGGVPEPIPMTSQPGQSSLRAGLPESIANYIKQNPTIITKSASPTPPPQMIAQQPMMNVMQNTSTPRAPSPTPQVLPNFMPQPSSSPRVPSPISK